MVCGLLKEAAMAKSPLQGKGPIGFALSAEQQNALKAIAGDRRVRLSGTVVGGRLQVDFVACNAAFMACNCSFTACNAAFTACNSPFKAEGE
jgi:hypothetical protein